MKQELIKSLAQLWVGSASVEINPERNGNPLDDRYALVVAGVEVDKFTSYTSAAEHLISLSNNPPVEIIELSRNDTIRIRSLTLNYGKGLPVDQRPQTCKVELESTDNNGKPIYFVLDEGSNQVNVCSFLFDNEELNKRCIERFPLSVLDGEIIQVGDISLVKLMNMHTIGFNRKSCGVISAHAEITIETSSLESHEDIIRAMKSAVTRWIDTTIEGQKILNYAGGEPNIADVAESLDSSPALVDLLKSHDVFIKSVSVNHGEKKEYLNAVSYDTNMYEKELSITVCPNCKSDLTEEGAIRREYAHKDGACSQFSEGFLEQDLNGNFNFETSGSANLSGGRYDLLDDSDKCSNCEHQL